MSRQNIDLSKPLSDEDRAYLEARDMQAQLDQNALALMGGGASETAGEDGPYSGWTKEQLHDEVVKRNEGREDDAKIVPDSKKNADLLAALEADDAATAAKAAEEIKPAE